jgi:hypothetical protein
MYQEKSGNPAHLAVVVEFGIVVDAVQEVNQVKFD